MVCRTVSRALNSHSSTGGDATIQVIANGTTNSDQTYILDAGGWRALGSVGFKYLGPTGVDGDPVKLVLLKRTLGGTAMLFCQELASGLTNELGGLMRARVWD